MAVTQYFTKVNVEVFDKSLDISGVWLKNDVKLYPNVNIPNRLHTLNALIGIAYY